MLALIEDRKGHAVGVATAHGDDDIGRAIFQAAAEAQRHMIDHEASVLISIIEEQVRPRPALRKVA